MTANKCPYCNEEKPGDGMLGHILLTEDIKHGRLGSLPEDFATSKKETVSQIDAEDRTEDQSLFETMGRILSIILSSILLNISIVGIITTISAIILMEGTISALMFISGVSFSIFALGFYIVIHR